MAKIKAEIERRIVYAIGFRDNVEQEERASFFNGEAVALKHLLSFLSNLESEKPMNLEELEKEIEKITVDTPPGYEELNNKIKSWGQNIARHFAEWGAEHLKK